MVHNRWQGHGRQGRKARALPPPAHPSPPRLPNGVRLLCALCTREARGFGFMCDGAWSAGNSVGFCSMRCLDAGGPRVGRQNGVIDKSRMETQAIKDARRFFAEVLTEMGLLAPFHDRTPAEIDRIIEACVDGFQDSMQRQAAARDPIDDIIPF